MEKMPAKTPTKKQVSTATAPVVATPLEAVKPPSFSGKNGYSVFVSIAKVALPFFAVILILLVIVWPQLEEQVIAEGTAIGKSILGDTPDTLSALNPKYLGLDDQEQPYTIIADLAEQSRERENEILLTLPKADISLHDGSWIALSARSGIYDKDAKYLTLDGNVNIFQDQGFEIMTQEAMIDVNAGSAYGQSEVNGHGPAGTVVSEGFVITDRGQRITFTGKSQLVILPDAQETLKK
ncbi:LPS export ABC transporter periplasmic protein LptC [Kiloniella laminariae]|uniref:LPS export ABC transporter periplasmic protein LptC n=1 Tax=Kiloniella laminariae TaxID=454162 RepID=A0ABT4LKA6_9PROT|nr:LPS export ABC transporter periplasmic protein LptC [Kiloniella laminariae]MCZ4281539.1 LPS export ABC transporter periplasmic protein LptC [Kiloniella laminariae]